VLSGHLDSEVGVRFRTNSISAIPSKSAVGAPLRCGFSVAFSASASTFGMCVTREVKAVGRALLMPLDQHFEGYNGSRSSGRSTHER
jgi:hypothetical protein